MSRLRFGWFALLATLSTSRAQAEPASLKPSSNAVCDRESTAIGRSACRLADSLAGHADSALVVAAAAVGDDRVALPGAVSERLAQLVATRLGASAQASKEPLTLPQAQRVSSSARGLIYLTVSLFRDRLDVSADVFAGAGHFWQRVKSPGLRLKAHTFTTTALDPELRALFPAIPLVVSRVDKAQTAEHDILALACGDLRGDGSSEIATVGRRHVQVGRLEHGRFTARASLNWSENSAIAASPLREPIAASAVPEPGRLWVGLSDRADALDLSSGLKVEHKWHALMPWPGAGCTRRSGIGYEGKARACPGSGAIAEVDFGNVVDAFDSRALTNRSGQEHTLRVARPVGADFARALDSLQPEVIVPNVGAQVAIGDLDEDGLPEIVSSSPSLDRRADQLLVRTLTDNGQLRERLRVPVPSGIDALAICPSDGRAMAPLALATGDGIWLIR
ncbi:MAG TPA: hypothetical protein VER11_19300 [Polyangiaceae bacterium]|nr:hypothetical protein [Polyangiaceae bacterium]